MKTKEKVKIKTGSIGVLGHEKTDPVVHMTNLKEKYSEKDTVKLTVFTVDHFDKIKSPVKTPVKVKSKYVGDLHWRLVDITTGKIVIDFDTEYNSTRLSTGESGYYFNFDMSSAPKYSVCKFEFLRVFRGSTSTLKTQKFARFKVV